MTGNPYAKQTWRAHAECRGTDPNTFVPEGRGNGLRLYLEARQICDRCPVKTACLDHALSNGEDMGMWGGLTPNERREIGYILTALCKRCGCPFRRLTNKNQYCDDCRGHRVRTGSSRP